VLYSLFMVVSLVVVLVILVDCQIYHNRDHHLFSNVRKLLYVIPLIPFIFLTDSQIHHPYKENIIMDNWNKKKAESKK